MAEGEAGGDSEALFTLGRRGGDATVGLEPMFTPGRSSTGPPPRPESTASGSQTATHRALLPEQPIDVEATDEEWRAGVPWRRADVEVGPELPISQERTGRKHTQEKPTVKDD